MLAQISVSHAIPGNYLPPVLTSSYLGIPYAKHLIRTGDITCHGSGGFRKEAKGSSPCSVRSEGFVGFGC